MLKLTQTASKAESRVFDLAADKSGRGFCQENLGSIAGHIHRGSATCQQLVCFVQGKNAPNVFVVHCTSFKLLWLRYGNSVSPLVQFQQLVLQQTIADHKARLRKREDFPVVQLAASIKHVHYFWS